MIMTIKDSLCNEFEKQTWQNLFDDDYGCLIDNYKKSNHIELLTKTKSFKKISQTVRKIMAQNDIQKYKIIPIALVDTDDIFNAYIVVTFMENESIGSYTIELTTTN